MKKLSIVLLLLALVLAVVPAAFAQDETFGASQEDFAAWIAANEATFSATSLSFDGSFSFEMAGMGEGTDDTSVDISFNGAVINDEENPGLQLTVSGKITEGDESTPVNVEIRLVDGIIYMNDGTGWVGSSLENASGSFMEGFAEGSGLPIDPSMLSGDMSNMGDMSSMMSGFEDLNPSDFLSLAHTDDDYTLSLDIGALLSSPALTGVIAGALGSAGPDAEMTDAQQQQMVQMVAMMFSETTISFTETVDPASSMVSNAVLDVNFPLDNILGPGAGLALNFDVSLSGFNEPVTVEVPEGAEMKDSLS